MGLPPGSPTEPTTEGFTVAPRPPVAFYFPNNGKRRFFWVTPFLANTHQADDEINKEHAMAKYLINIAKSQYYLDNNLNWNAAQCNLQNH